jgi:WD40 repeat protein
MIALLLLASVAPPVADPLPPGAIARLGSARWVAGFTGFGTAFSPDGKRIALGRAGKVALLDAQTGEVVHEIAPKDLPAPGLAYIDNMMAWDARRGYMILRNSETLAVADPTGKRPSHVFPGSRATWVGDGSLLLRATYHGDFAVRDLDSGKDLHTGKLETRSSIDQRSLSGHPRREEFAYSTGDGTVVVLEARTGKVRWRVRGHNLSRSPTRWTFTDILSTYDPTGKWLATGGPDGTVRLWHADDGKPGPVLTLGNTPCLGLIWADRERLVVAFLSGEIEVYRGRTCVRRWRTTGLGSDLCLAVSPDGTTLVAHCSNRTVLACWDLETGQSRHPTRQSEAPINKLKWLSESRLLSADRSGRVLEWDVPARRVERQLEVGWGQLAWSAEGERLAHAQWKNEEIRVLHRQTGKVLTRLPVPEGKIINTLSFTPEGDQLLGAFYSGYVGSSSTLRLWNLRTARVDFEKAVGAEGADREVSSALLANDGTIWVGSSGSRGSAGILQGLKPATGKEVLKLDTSEYVSSLVVHPRGHEIAFVQGLFRPSEVVVLNLSERSRSRIWRSGIRGASRITYSPCGRFLAGAGREKADHWVAVWEAHSGQLVRTYRLPGCASTVAFSPSGRLLASAGYEGQIFLWDLSGRQRPDGSLAVWRPDADAFQQAWESLGAADAAGYDSAWRLAAAPEVAGILLAKKLRPLLPLPEPRFQELLSGLESDEFKIRQQCEQQLIEHGPGAQGQIERALPGSGLESRRRLERVLKRWREDPEALRSDRALFALEQMGEAGRPLLYRLAEGVPEAEITQMARAALKRRR